MKSYRIPDRASDYEASRDDRDVVTVIRNKPRERSLGIEPRAYFGRSGWACPNWRMKKGNEK